VNVLRGARILILGLAYKPEVDILTESPALDLIRLFQAEGAEVDYSDPFVPSAPRSMVHGALSARASGTESRAHDSISSNGNDGRAKGAPSGACQGVAPAGTDEGALASIALDRDSIAAVDAVVVATDHAGFDWDLVADHARLVIDTRNALASRMAGRSNYFKS
jgi:UDP-N-acetyl-D-glucosamine dehydrogenase